MGGRSLQLGFQVGAPGDKVGEREVGTSLKRYWDAGLGVWTLCCDCRELWRIWGSHFRKIHLEWVLLMRIAVREKECGFWSPPLPLCLGSVLLGEGPFCPPHPPLCSDLCHLRQTLSKHRLCLEGTCKVATGADTWPFHSFNPIYWAPTV